MATDPTIRFPALPDLQVEIDGRLRLSLPPLFLKDTRKFESISDIVFLTPWSNPHPGATTLYIRCLTAVPAAFAGAETPEWQQVNLKQLGGQVARLARVKYQWLLCLDEGLYIHLIVSPEKGTLPEIVPVIPELLATVYESDYLPKNSWKFVDLLAEGGLAY